MHVASPAGVTHKVRAGGSGRSLAYFLDGVAKQLLSIYRSISVALNHCACVSTQANFGGGGGGGGRGGGVVALLPPPPPPPPAPPPL